MNSWFKEDALAGNTALVIGASTESGPAICRLLACHGAMVAFTYLKNVDAASQLEAELLHLGRESRSYPLNLFAMDQVRQLPRRVLEEFGRLEDRKSVV